MHIHCHTTDAERHAITILAQYQLYEGNDFFKVGPHTNDSSITITISRPLSQGTLDTIRDKLQHASDITLEESAM
jgi:hypothetical protein